MRISPLSLIIVTIVIVVVHCHGVNIQEDERENIEPFSLIFSGIFSGIEYGYKFFKGRSLYDSANKMRKPIIKLYHQIYEVQTELGFVDSLLEEFAKRHGGYRLPIDAKKMKSSFQEKAGSALKDHEKTMKETQKVRDDEEESTSLQVKAALKSETQSAAISVSAAAVGGVAAKLVPIVGPIFAGAKAIHTIYKAPASYYDKDEGQRAIVQRKTLQQAECSIIRGVLDMMLHERTKLKRESKYVGVQIGLTALRASLYRMYRCRCYQKVFSPIVPKGFAKGACRKPYKDCSILMWGRTNALSVRMVKRYIKRQLKYKKGEIRHALMPTSVEHYSKIGNLLLPKLLGFRVIVSSVRCTKQDDTVGKDEIYLVVNERKHVLGDFSTGMTQKYHLDITPASRGTSYIQPRDFFSLTIFEKERMASDSVLGDVLLQFEDGGVEGIKAILRTAKDVKVAFSHKRGLDVMKFRATGKKADYLFKFHVEAVHKEDMKPKGRKTLTADDVVNPQELEVFNKEAPQKKKRPPTPSGGGRQQLEAQGEGVVTQKRKRIPPKTKSHRKQLTQKKKRIPPKANTGRKQLEAK